MPTGSGRSLLLAGLVRVLADAELVALGIGEHGPDKSGHLVLTYYRGPKPHEARYLGYTRTAAEVYMNSVLTHAWFGHPLQCEHRATAGRPRQEHEIAVITLDGDVERF